MVRQTHRAQLPPPDEVLRAAALLGLDEGGGVVLLAGCAALLADAIESERQVATLLLNPLGMTPGPGYSVLLANDAVPVAAGTLRGVLLDESNASAATLLGAARALRARGRLVAPASADVPPGVRELARDARQWVAEAAPPGSPPVPLRRR